MAWAERNAPQTNAAFQHSSDRSSMQASIGRSTATIQASRLVVVEPQRRWVEAVKTRLDELCRLPKNWNGYGASPVSFSNAHFAFKMLEICCAYSTPVPSIVPGANGDLQIEWHLTGGDIELHIRGPYDVHAWRLPAGAADDGEEIELTSDFSLVDRWIRDLLDYPRAIDAAAA